MKRAQAAAMSAAIRTLLSHEPDEQFERPRALFDFISCFRWPNDNEVRQIASSLYLVKFISDELETDRKEAARAILERLNMSQFVSLILSEALIDFSFTVLPPELSDDRTVADMVRFLISWDPESEDRRDAPSIKKAHFFLGKHRGYGWKSTLGWRRFNDIWVQHKAVAHFMYVNEYHFGRKLLLDPTKRTFSQSVRDILADRQALEKFMREALFVHNKLQRVLYRITWQGVSLAEFPPGLEPLPIRTREPDEKMRTLMRGYKGL